MIQLVGSMLVQGVHGDHLVRSHFFIITCNCNCIKQQQQQQQQQQQ